MAAPSSALSSLEAYLEVRSSCLSLSLASPPYGRWVPQLSRDSQTTAQASRERGRDRKTEPEDAKGNGGQNKGISSHPLFMSLGLPHLKNTTNRVT